MNTQPQKPPESLPPAPPPTSPAALSQRRKYLMGLMAVLLAGVGGSLWLLLRPQPTAPIGQSGEDTPPPEGWLLPAVAAETDEARAAKLGQVWNEQTPVANPAQWLELSAFFRALGQAEPAEGSPAAAVCDLERLYREALRQGILTPEQVQVAATIRQDLILKLHDSAPEHLATMASVDRFDHLLVVRAEGLTPVAPATEAVVAYVQRFDPGGHCAKERWWLEKSAAGWRIYDYENLYTGTRYSQYLACLLKDAQENRNSAISDLFLLRGWLERSGDSGAEASAHLAQLPSIQGAAAPVQALLLYCRGMIALQAGDLATADISATAALRLQPHLMAARYLAGECHNRSADYEAALQDAQLIEAQLGRDPFAAELRATAFLGLDRSRELAAQFQVILDFKPTDAAAIGGLWQWLPPGERAAVYPRYTALMQAAEDPQTLRAADDLFHRLGEEAIVTGDAPALTALIEARLRGRKNSATAAVAGTGATGSVAEAGDELSIVYRVKVFQLKNDWAGLRAYVTAALPDMKDAQLRDLVRDSGWRAAAKQQQALAAYQAAGAEEQTPAFRALCEGLRSQGDVEGLAELILAYNAGHAGDPWIHFYAGVRSMMQVEYGRAEAHFEEGLKIAPAESLPLFRSYWLSAAYHADRGIQAFGRATDKKAAFQQLKQYFLEDGRDELLEMLVEQYRPVAGDDPEFVLGAADVYFLTHDYQSAVNLLTARKALVLKGSDAQVFEYFDCYMRCLIRQQQFTVAEATLQEVRDMPQEAFLSAMVAAAEGKTDATLVALRHCLKAGFTKAMIYGDVDLGPALRRPEMQAGIGKEFPPPAEPVAPPAPGEPKAPDEPKP